MPTNAAVQISVWLRLRNAINSAHKMILNAAKINHDRKNSRKIYAPLLSVYVNFPKSTKVCTGFAKSCKKCRAVQKKENRKGTAR